ncbi:polysaccharide deacetylase family protein [Nocardioides marmoriginsengisoli]|uniref:Polysaccharide deacetylase family protein n=1 Tax=Nocardioides marmoriginsengisoli TaxID=661483 RepID=A0A3N0CFW0_9ACTN|nr:polysaccharide deacetylase family protein [Nocardioides marmoriginsengisoli]RNL62121.1 polysaccharide deacetylase family protein [Nocardioides marmoriginsengisoli]
MQHRFLTRRNAPALLIAALALTASSLGLHPASADPVERTVSGASEPVASVLPQPVRRHKLPRACRSGLVALTFDDGPSKSVTPGLVKILLKRKVPATFFMVGSRIHSAPQTARLVQRSGFTIGNHTYTHAQLTRLSDSGVRRQLRSTRREMREHKITPSDLMRPPYGDISKRVRRDIRGLGLVPVLWTIDSRDWAGGTPGQIADRVLRGLRRHQSNIVLQHDGVNNSPNSVAAVPRIVKEARKRGFCFTHIGPRGGPALPQSATPKPPEPPKPATPAPTPTPLPISFLSLKN